jgi:exodeoxyribonuclease VII large subunit
MSPSRYGVAVAQRGPDLFGSIVEDRPGALSVAAFYRRVSGALTRAFPRTESLWVRGEVQSISDRTGHCYLDLIDPSSNRSRQSPVLKVKCWESTWRTVRSTLAEAGLALAPGMVVTLRGTIDFYPPRGEVGLVLAELDVTALLGRMAARRAALLRALEAEGLLRLNRKLDVPDVPLCIGMVASPGTEGYRDFLGQLDTSGYGFHVVLAAVPVQGAWAPARVAAALTAVGRAGCDIVVLVRGGGSKGDLAALDAEAVARAVATCPVPVWTGIGHTGDQSVADVVANQAFVTPTECGQALVQTVSSWWDGLDARAEHLARRAAAIIADVDQRHHQCRARLATCTRNQLVRHRERLDGRAGLIARQAHRGVTEASTVVTAQATRIGPLALAQLQNQADRLQSWRRLLAAYDVTRQLERGYTLTLDPEGRIVRSAGSVSPGAPMLTKFADGTVHSEVQRVELASAVPADQTRDHSDDKTETD